MLEQYIFLFIFLTITIFGLISCICWMRAEKKNKKLFEENEKLHRYIYGLEYNNARLKSANDFYKNQLKEKENVNNQN